MNTPKPPNGSRTLRLKTQQTEKPSEVQIKIGTPQQKNQQFTKKDKSIALAPPSIVKTGKPSKKIKKSRQANVIRDGGIATTVDGSARIPVVPRPVQKEILDGLFAGPRLIRQMLAECNEPISTDEDASLFMLKHYKELQPHLYSQRRDDAVNLLRSLIKEWSVAMPEDIELLLPGDCSISAEQQIYLPIPGLGTLSPLDAEAVKRLRMRRRYEDGFVLLNKKGKYFVEVAFEKSEFREPQKLSSAINIKQNIALRSTHEAKNNKSLSQNRAKKVRPSAINIDSFLSMFNNTINRRLME